MKSDLELKEIVRQKYEEIALQDKVSNTSSCCGSGGCSTEVYNIMTDSYEKLDGYIPEADLGLGCGLPTEFALIKEGQVVLDLGSGAGNDAFVARSLTGPTGKVLGVDFTEAMINKARNNAEKLGYHNVEFRYGDIEALPISDESVDVVVSNCVLNLVPNKIQAFGEMFRILKVGGHFSISDIVLEGNLPQDLKQAAEMYAGCVSGAIKKSEYLDIINQTGFTNIKIQKQKEIIIPDDILANYLNAEQIKSFRENDDAIYSITVYGEKQLVSCNNGGCC